MSFVLPSRLHKFTNKFTSRRINQDKSFSPKALYKARWAFDAKFGCKTDALQLVNEFVNNISPAIPSLIETQITHGAIGVSESNIELELKFEDITGLESFWNSVPANYHREWSNHMQPLIVDGSARWTVHHIYTTPSEEGKESDTKESSTGIIIPESTEEVQQILKEPQTKQVVEPEPKEKDKDPDRKENRVIRDWKGDKIRLNPGDKLPFSFE